MIPQALVLGYHGCEFGLSRRLALGKAELAASNKQDHWLGTGVYFWASDAQRAMEWARQPRLKIRQPSVIGAVIDLGYCLNLTQREAVESVAEAHRNLKQFFTLKGQDLPKNLSNKQRPLDCMVINHLHELRKLKNQREYDSVIGYFAEGESIYEGGELRHQNHLQICVRNPSCILGYFLPKQVIMPR
jgi:hypothetical protein